MFHATSQLLLHFPVFAPCPFLSCCPTSQLLFHTWPLAAVLFLSYHSMPIPSCSGSQLLFHAPSPAVVPFISSRPSPTQLLSHFAGMAPSPIFKIALLLSFRFIPYAHLKSKLSYAVRCSTPSRYASSQLLLMPHPIFSPICQMSFHATYPAIVPFPRFFFSIILGCVPCPILNCWPISCFFFIPHAVCFPCPQPNCRPNFLAVVPYPSQAFVPRPIPSCVSIFQL